MAVIAGAAVWAVLWLGGAKAGQAAFPALLAEGQPVTSIAALLGLIAYSVALSALAGYVAAVVGRAMTAVWSLAVLQLTLGIVAEVSYWSLMPVWYHVVFLALIVPATVWGGMKRGLG